MAITNPDIDAVVQTRPVVLVFVPNTNELQRFVLSGAFEGLAVGRRLHYVLPDADAARMRAAAPMITVDNSSTIAVPPERFRRWSEIFKAGCLHYARFSPSFALREGLDVDPLWKEHWHLPADERAAIDREFDAKVATMLEGMAPLPEIVDLFNRLMPLYCLVPTSLLDLFCNEVSWACETEDVPCVLLQSGWDNMSSKGLVYGRTTYLGCWGPQSREHAIVIQRMKRERIALLGAPHYEFLKPASDVDVRRLREELGVREGEQLVLFGGSFRQFDETSTLRLLERAIARGRLGPVRIVYRPHPWRAARKHEDSFFNDEWSHVVFDPDMRDRYLREQTEAGYIKRNSPMFDMGYLSTLISACDAVISPMSTLLVEALILGKPIMAIAFGDGKHRYNPSVTAQTTHFAEMRASEALIWCDDSERLIKSCAQLLKGPRPKWHEKTRLDLLERIVARGPGTYAERLADFCRSRIEGSARKLRARRTGVKRDTISHSYGAHLIAREYSGVTDSAASVPGYWMHGWLPAHYNIDPAIVAEHKREGQVEGYDFSAQIVHDKAHTPQWVARADQADYLRAHGYQQAHAIGLPIVYLPAPDVRRVPGSLLVMPPHGHGTHGPDDPLAEQYAEQIAAIRHRFTYVWVGITDDDMAKQQWVESFRKRGIDVFVTTDAGDPNTLVRLRQILATFEYVTTNGFGSQIAIAAYCGAKVSVFGPYAEYPREQMKRTFGVKVFPHLLDQACAISSEAALRQHYPFLFVEPDAATVMKEWGALEVGEPHRVTPEALRTLFGWQQPASASQPASTGDGRAMRPLVLFGMSHEGFFRNFQDVVNGLVHAGVDVHVQFSKAHSTISMADYALPGDEARGRLTYSTSDAGARRLSLAVERVRLIRDLVLYSRPQYTRATDLRARFSESQKRHVLSAAAQRGIARVLRWVPEFVKDAADMLLARIDAQIPPQAAATRLLETLRPDYVIVTPMVNFASREVDLVKAARRRGTSTLLAVASWDNLTNKGRIKVIPDRVAVWNEAMAREAVELHGVTRDRIWITGAPVFDGWFDRSPTHDRKEFCRLLGLQPDRPLVVYLCSSNSIAGPAEYEVIDTWLAAIREYPLLRGANVLVRPHPMALAGWKAVVRPDGRNRASWNAAAVWPVEPKHPTNPQTRTEFFDTLYHADAIVGLNTSAMIEAAILGKPVFTFLGHERAESQAANLHFQYLAEGGCAVTAVDLRQHARQLADHLERPADAAAGCAHFVRRFIRPLSQDVNASAALVDFVLRDLGVTQRGETSTMNSAHAHVAVHGRA